MSHPLDRPVRSALISGWRAFAEASDVCTHPDHRGRGQSAGLMREVMTCMMRRGETPLLHSYAGNHAAIGLYKGLVFIGDRPSSPPSRALWLSDAGKRQQDRLGILRL
ncbi:GNAT family N-acetyltransferase [Asticcacaulis sp. AND118]|uniref:GNAT family N-acetyltransferase n=1 Tax=Asticcacaulis sp. AND118 TaxID=2840468 RepID=UPI001CFF6A03|nr:GNAT family N-acetyltransferase [Asticcacaulis sp. AND118]